MHGSYDFLVDLRRLAAIYRRTEHVLCLLNAAVIAMTIYIVALLAGIPAFFRFYWQDVFFLAEAPAITSLVLGLFVAYLMKRRSKSDMFQNLEGTLSVKAKTAYDNRDVDSVIMQSLAEDVKRNLSKLGASDLINSNKVSFREKSVPALYLKAAGVLFLFAGIVMFSQSQVSEDISPTDFQSLMDIKERATGLFQEEEEFDEGTSDSGLAGEIYGKPSLAVLEEVNLELQLYPGSGAGFRSETTEPVDRIFQAATPGEGVAVPTELYIESLPPQHREIIKRYFENLAKG